MDQKKIGRFLKELRKEKDITHEQLAEEEAAEQWEKGV